VSTKGKKMSKSELSLPVDLVRTIAIVFVIGLHAANEPHQIITLPLMSQAEIWRWWTINIYDTFTRLGVPLFVMLTGALLLQPAKVEPLGVFFRKRFARIGLPFIFWGIIYFAYDFLVIHQSFSWSFVAQGILTGPYYHFWFLYMLVGLYLLTPILRIVIAHADRRFLKYFVFLWLLGPIIVPIPTLFGSYHLDANLLTIPWWAGYYFIGAYLITVKIHRSLLYVLLSLGFVLTAAGTYLVTLLVGGSLALFFQDYFSPTIILASVAFFALLLSVRTQSDQVETHHAKTNWLLGQISQNTLPIYLFHVMVLEALQNGVFGFRLSVNSLFPAVEVPLITLVTLFICLGLILPAKKVPVLKRLIG
jgi:surface polysaccharide O-acyltransferase-like enzyme